MDYYRNFDQLVYCDYSQGASGINYYIVTEPTEEPVTPEFFKEHARIDFDTDDNLVAAYLKAARQELEQWTQLSFTVKTMGIKAKVLPDNYKLMYGPVNAVTDPATGFEVFGDIISPGGEDVTIQYTTKGNQSELVRIAICRYAAGLYVWRENLVESKYSASAKMDEAKRMLAPIMNITFP